MLTTVKRYAHGAERRNNKMEDNMSWEIKSKHENCKFRIYSAGIQHCYIPMKYGQRCTESNCPIKADKSLSAADPCTDKICFIYRRYGCSPDRCQFMNDDPKPIGPANTEISESGIASGKGWPDV